MVIAKSYFTIDQMMFKLLFNETLYEPIQLDIIFNRGKLDGNMFFLSYYNFNILLSQTKSQNTLFHVLDDEFFNDLSLHKTKITFCGYIDDEKTSFTPTHVIYNYPNKKMGILVKKKIVKKFKEKGIEMIIPKQQANENITKFLIA